MPPNYVANLERAVQVANDLLLQNGVTKAPVAVEDLAVGQGVSVRFEDLEANISGVLIQRAGRVFAAINKSHHPNRQRFTIAHELGHFMLHANLPGVFVDDALVYFRDDDQLSSADAREIEANVFAANVLMPKALLESDLRGRYVDAFDDAALRSLVQKYKVSQQALVIRLTRLGLLGGVPRAIEERS